MLPTATQQSLTNDGVRYLIAANMVVLLFCLAKTVGEQCHKTDDLFFPSGVLLGWLSDILENLA
jgi:hypothetical protein